MSNNLECANTLGTETANRASTLNDSTPKHTKAKSGDLSDMATSLLNSSKSLAATPSKGDKTMDFLDDEPGGKIPPRLT